MWTIHLTLSGDWGVGKEREQMNLLEVLSQNNDRFAYGLDELERYISPPNLNSRKDILRPDKKMVIKYGSL